MKQILSTAIATKRIVQEAINTPGMKKIKVWVIFMLLVGVALFLDFGSSIILFVLALYNIRNIVRTSDVKIKIAYGMVSLTMAALAVGCAYIRYLCLLNSVNT